MSLRKGARVSGNVAQPSRDSGLNQSWACAWPSWAGDIKAISTLTSSKKAVISGPRPAPGLYSCSRVVIREADRKLVHRLPSAGDAERQTPGALARIRLCRWQGGGWRHSALQGESRHDSKRVWFS